ncbi:MAG: hypothetical protein WCF30_20535 [Terracidiphilus sp.]
MPALFFEQKDHPITQLSARHWREFPLAGAALRDAFGENLDWVGDAVAVPVSPSSLHALPGGPVRVMAQNGELGAPVTWNGCNGYLTAGHVGQSLNEEAYDENHGNIGKVVFVRTANAIQPQGCAGSSVDVAIIKLYPGLQHGYRYSIGIPQPNDTVVVHTRRGMEIAQIYGAARWWYVSKVGVTLTEVYLSSRGVTEEGDSGGPVLLARSKGQIIGSIVSGGTATSCFQDIAHQLSEIRKDPNFQNIRL